MRMPVKPISEFIYDLAAEANDPGGQYTLTKMLRLVTSSMQELNLWVIPNYLSVREATDSNNNLDMPEDTIIPLRAWRVIKCKQSGNDILLNLGQIKKSIKYPDNLYCGETPEATIASCAQTSILNFTNRPDSLFWVYNPNYLESYGARTSRFFGWWEYSEVDNRMEFSGFDAGEVVIVTYQTTVEDHKVIPIDAIPMLRHMVLSRHYAPSNGSLSQYHWAQFRIRHKMFKKNRLDTWSNEDWADAITSEYASSLSE